MISEHLAQFQQPPMRPDDAQYRRRLNSLINKKAKTTWALEEALHPGEGETKTGLTEAALFGLRKQNVKDAETLLPYNVASFLRHRGYTPSKRWQGVVFFQIILTTMHYFNMFADPTWQEGKPPDDATTQKIANLRIFVEQAIRRLKTFRILNYELPETLLSQIDKMWFIASSGQIGNITEITTGQYDKARIDRTPSPPRNRCSTSCLSNGQPTIVVHTDRKLPKFSGGDASLSFEDWLDEMMCRNTWKDIAPGKLVKGVRQDAWLIKHCPPVTQCLRRIEGIRWHDFISNESIRLTTKQVPLSARIAKQRLTFLGHVAKATPTQEVIKLTTSDPDPSWKRPRGRPRGRWEDQVFNTLHELGVSRSDWTVHAQCRTRRRELSVAVTHQHMMHAND
uniref:DDE Tnp4 domain-containing protein n=1 Tax=Branchiostoma floridae TaxID=7739 RepID=C3ZUR1_BRAFL|eukprot:XP_002587762.1 hypothetical protein BRAFLDRAFT_94666 [Branchiostoma floridae]